MVKIVPKVPENSGGGNTNLPLKPKQISPSIHWFFTFNNYTKEDIIKIVPILDDYCSKYCFQEEKGESGTIHLQGVISLKNKMRPSQLNLSKSIHWEKVKDLNQAYKYCSKEESRNGQVYTLNYKVPKPLKLIQKLRPWQEDLKNILVSEPDERSVYWIFDEIGNGGKSAFSKYMHVKHNVLVIQGGKLADIMNIIFNTDMEQCEAIIIDVPRINKNNISYSAVECLKNGMITNTKYETGTKVFNPPHVMIFSNYLPEDDKLSKDRWKLYELHDNLLKKRDMANFDDEKFDFLI